MSYKKQELLTLREHPGLPVVFCRVRVAHLFSFLCCVICFICLPLVSCVPNVSCLSGLSILDRPIGFLLRLLTFSLIFNY